MTENATNSDFIMKYKAILKTVETFTAETIEVNLVSMIEHVQALLTVAQDNFNNVPHEFQEDSTADILQTQIDICEGWLEDLNNICTVSLNEKEWEDEGDTADEKKNDLFLEIMDEIGECEPGFE